MRRHPDPLAIALAVLLSFLIALTVLADHESRARYDDVSGLAAQLDDAAYDAYLLSERRSFASLDEAFNRFAEATQRFRESARYDSRAAGRDFQHLARDYYELRGEFRYYDGPGDLRRAFHRINAPMERLYRNYTGRDLYRDDPNVRRSGARSRHPHHDRVPDVRPRDREHGHRDRDVRRRGRHTRGRGHR